MTVSKLDEGVSSGKLNEPPKSCIPNKAKMKMNKNNKNKREMIEERAFIRAKGLKKKRKSIGRSEQGLIKKKSLGHYPITQTTFYFYSNSIQSLHYCHNFNFGHFTLIKISIKMNFKLPNCLFFSL